MRLVGIDELAPGMKVARTVRYEFGGVMLRAGFVMDTGTIRRLREFGFSNFFVHDPDTEDVDIYDYMDERSRQDVTAHIQKLFGHIKGEVTRVFKPAELKNIPLEEFKYKFVKGRFRKILDEANIRSTFLQFVELIVQNLLSDREISMCVGAIKSANSYIYDHSFEVAVHAAVTARRLGFTTREVKEIVLGSLLHDIGFLFIPDDIMQKQEPLTEKEQEILRQHTTYGYYLLRDREDIPLLTAHVAYQHHERQDGLGYPRGLRGTNRVISKMEAIRLESGDDGAGMIHRYSNIVAVPNFYDELISPRPYRKAIPPDEAVEAVKLASGTVLNEEVVEAFLSYLPVYPLGTRIVIVKGKYAGWKGVVVKVEPQRLDKPIVRLLHDKRKKLRKPIDIDLDDDNFKIKAILS